MNRKLVGLSLALVMLALGASLAPAVAAHGTARSAAGEQCNNGNGIQLESTIAFSSTRDNPTILPAADAAEIYVINPDGTNPRRLTDNTTGDGFPNLSPDGKKIVFDSNRLTDGTVINGVTYHNIDDLFLMKPDGSEQTLLTRGSSATWSPDCKEIAFHASASYYASGGLISGLPIRTDPGSATSDSDIFVAKVGDLLDGTGQPTNITNGDTTIDLNGNTVPLIDDDPDWSPNGDKIVYTAHPTTDNQQFSNQAEIYVRNADGTDVQQLTHNDYEERAPAWSPDGTRIVFMCRIDGGKTPFEICVMNADGTGLQRLTTNNVPDLTPTFSPDGQQIVFHRSVTPGNPQLWLMNADGTGQTPLTCSAEETCPAPLGGINLIAHWGQLKAED